MTWWQALIDGGAVPAAFVPPPASRAGLGSDIDAGTERADIVED